MKGLKDLLPLERIRLDMTATDSAEAISELLDVVVAGQGLAAERRDEAMLSLLKREAMAATVLGHGVAVPHARLKRFSGFQMALGLSRGGVDFRASDGQKVHAVLLLLSSDADDSWHLRVMGSIARVTKALQVDQLLRLRTPQKVQMALRLLEGGS